MSKKAGSELVKAARKVENCSVMGLFRSLSTEVNHGVGRALCKCRVCPTCQRVVSHKRKAHLMSFFDVNEDRLKGYRFYHLVLTVRHSKAGGIRTNLYTSELLKYYTALRGSDGNRAAHQWWNQHVAGGTFSVELKAGRDGSPHIHIHSLLLSTVPLCGDVRKSAFEKELRRRWKHLTGDSTHVHLEPVYYLDEQRQKVYFDAQQHEIAHLRRAVSECAKYTLKADADALRGFDADFVADLLATRNRYYGRFGVLSRNKKDDAFEHLDMLNTDFKDLEQVQAHELEQLYNPQTGEVVPKEQTRLAMTSFRNTRARAEDVGPGYYSFVNPDDVVYFTQQAQAAQALNYSLKRRHQPDQDMPPPPNDKG